LSPETRVQACPLVVLVGNPNVGKTTLFNRLTGQSARVGNYPGITVERRVGTLRLDVAQETRAADLGAVDLVDVPGAYSLSARSVEEQIAISSVLGLGEHQQPALAILVADAGQLIRNLYLALQLVELGVELVIALNMVDEAAENAPSPQAVSQLLGVPCVATNGRSGEGLRELKQAVLQALLNQGRGAVHVRYPPELLRDVDWVADAIPQEWRGGVERDRALAMWALSSVDADDELAGIPHGLRERCQEVHQRATGRDIDHEIINARYTFLDAHSAELYQKSDAISPVRKLTQRLDRVLLHPVWGFGIFLVVMFTIFQALFSWSEPGIRLVEHGVTGLQALTVAILPAGVTCDLLSQGVIGGVGNVLVFLPQILLLFLFVGVLEDTGYMARVAYLMDRVMKTLGLHGRAFVPMLSGYACAVPAILATRTMERRRDRLLTMLVIPLMTCSARLPVYTLVIAALFPASFKLGWIPVQPLLMVGMYLFGTAMALICAAVLGRTVVRGRRVPLILELPPYRKPQAQSVLKLMWERSTVFLKEAGTIILFCTVALWGLLSFPKTDAVTAPVATLSAKQTVPALQADPAPATKTVAREASTGAGPARPDVGRSYAGRLGKAIEPALAPLGFDWKIGVGIIGAFAAREVFISTMALVYGIGSADDQAPLRERIRAESVANGKPVYSPLTGLSLLVFFALACQCMSTLAVVRRETKSWVWPGFLFGYMTTLAYAMSFVVYQGGKLLGF
jgi:ferrous iron transport protein B